ncbi:MAG: glyceraldehyde-3-phosphate dehydrogenase [Patescibacteria group bacterium]|nr:MAG: glyceraldehyde-3-phosphate dehydrogenase [Patescibacteria group bacterium]
MKKINVGLNGFGRIGRAFARIAFSGNYNFQITAVNTRKSQAKELAYLLKYDSVYRTYDKEVTVEDNKIIVDGNAITAYNYSNPNEIPWQEHNVQIVVDATGAFTTSEALKGHLHGTVQKVVLSAPAKDNETPHIVLGVNDKELENNYQIISNASCTTNSASPLFLGLDLNFKVKKGFLVTAHAYTSTQPLLDDAGKDATRSRAAGLNIVPTTTGAAEAVVKTLPHLKGKIDGMAVRVPVPTVSFTIITAEVEKPTTVEEVNQTFKTLSETTLAGILKYEDKPLVSSDYIGSSYSSIFDANYTKVVDQTQITICGWYDNEWGYSNRLVELVDRLAQSL